MENSTIDDVTQDVVAEAEVASELEEAKDFARTLAIEDVTSGQWFIALLQQVVQSYNRNARAAYFQQKYPGLPPDEIADILTSVTVKYATIAGAISGAAVTATQLGVLGTGGMTLPAMATAMAGMIGAEMVYLAGIQMRLILDLAVVYDIQIDYADPEDILMIFGYAMGVVPVEMVGKRLSVAAGVGTKYAIKKFITKGTRETVLKLGNRIGIKLTQTAIINKGVPFASAAVGSSYNYVTTKSVGSIAKNHLKNRGKVTEELRQLVSRQNTYDLAFPAAAIYMAQIDGEFSDKEKELYRALLSRMSFDEHTQAEFIKLMADEGTIIQAIAQIEDDEIRSILVEVLVLMAIYDGELVEEERDFLIKTASELNVALDINEIERRAEDYRVVVEENIFQKAAGSTKESVARAAVIAGQAAGSTKESVARAAVIAELAAGNAKGVAATAGGKVTGAFGNVFRRKKDEGSNTGTGASVVICVNCKNEVAVEYKFCPACGQSMAT